MRKVLLGIWLNAEFSNHEGCGWLNEPIPVEELEANINSRGQPMSKKDKRKLDAFDYHEALDRASMIRDIMEDQLACMPAIRKHKKLRKSLEKSMDIIGELYQDIGRVSDKKFHPIDSAPVFVKAPDDLISTIYDWRA